MQKKIHFAIKGQIGLKFYEVKEKEKFVLTTRISPEPLESARACGLRPGVGPS